MGVTDKIANNRRETRLERAVTGQKRSKSRFSLPQTQQAKLKPSPSHGTKFS